MIIILLGGIFALLFFSMMTKNINSVSKSIGDLADKINKKK